MIKIILDDKGIASAELLFVTLIFIVISMSFIGLVNSGMDKTSTGELGKARMLGENIVGTINLVYTNGKGYSAVVNLPDDFNFTASTVYNSTSNTEYLYMDYNHQIIKIKLIPPNNVSSVNMTTGQRYKIKNDNGTITFTLL